jgi:hypothetical protein
MEEPSHTTLLAHPKKGVKFLEIALLCQWQTGAMPEASETDTRIVER